jgi:hypothetical protein
VCVISQHSSDLGVILTATPQGACVLHITWLVVRAIENVCYATVAKMFGHHVHEMIGQNISVLLPDPIASQHQWYLQRYTDAGVPVRFVNPVIFSKCIVCQES